MINTIEIKQQQLEKGYYSIGNGVYKLLILGSCRAVPYVTYFNDYNKQFTNTFTIYFIDPFNWNWDASGNRVDYIDALSKQESNKSLTDMLSSVDFFIHEYYANAGMFNVFKGSEKNIYQFGLNPRIDICLPNFNDIFILSREIVSFDVAIRKMAIQDYNVNGKLSEQTIKAIEYKSQENLNKFYNICRQTSFPEFEDIFKSGYKNRRFFWTFNHVAKAFNQELFKLMSENYFHFDLNNYYICQEDLFANNYTYLSEYDLGYNWNEEIKPLKDVL
jgi:hypothetical protein